MRLPVQPLGEPMRIDTVMAAAVVAVLLLMALGWDSQRAERRAHDVRAEQAR